jgi:hypothetical protein
VDIQLAVPILLLVLVALAALIRQWWAVALPLLAVPLFYVGLRNGWWGDGVGDGWQFAAAAVTIVGLLGAMLGVTVGRVVHGRVSVNSRSRAS